eukprot:41572-Chlamydomonas_euryale.AAC.4
MKTAVYTVARLAGSRQIAGAMIAITCWQWQWRASGGSICSVDIRVCGHGSGGGGDSECCRDGNNRHGTQRTRIIQHACSIRYAACSMQHATFSVSMQRTVCSVQHEHAVCSMQREHAVYSTQHAA